MISERGAGMLCGMRLSCMKTKIINRISTSKRSSVHPPEKVIQETSSAQLEAQKLGFWASAAAFGPRPEDGYARAWPERRAIALPAAGPLNGQREKLHYIASGPLPLPSEWWSVNHPWFCDVAPLRDKLPDCFLYAKM